MIINLILHTLSYPELRFIGDKNYFSYERDRA
jgi:hypothetical protein